MRQLSRVLLVRRSKDPPFPCVIADGLDLGDPSSDRSVNSVEDLDRVLVALEAAEDVPIQETIPGFSKVA